ncbi:MBOAT family O-acyltransferase [Dinghuibacter silviterrae]|uniref:D-alanyl-lipoteichoic acid acyltransferase DltB (MBOAT superfamily) n=1 Tax=Dinghuibacter silviterrae TaxID=1539049 RepID=A0A4V3GKL9_9BACT|nr:MBOAT family O-acyltransferase [Dinghuibacter silviterrae]TDW96172.1 D-alanyl-lipoteichoic acid acyltransferase DltB (MBOAT superfamily) [Dinghuibacter silviterrae]
MLFNSLQFLVFFMVVTLSYYQLTRQKTRILLLLVAGCYFYMTFVPWYILILGGMIVIDFLAALQIGRSRGYTRRAWLTASIAANVGLLVVFKYAHFLHLPFPYLILPIGLSFHTFQAMSYTIEVYRGRQEPEQDFSVYALYVLFYPQLVAGPIERPQHLLPQLREYREYRWDNVKEGLARMFWGFFKKVVIADRLGMAVDYSYDHLHTQGSLHLFTSALLYSFQIYADFSGYCDIGIGAARVMGIGLMENFDEPYTAGSIASFWTRWHISLSTWFRDYVYIPLGGKHQRKRNVMITFLLSGLWHGANWTFVLWGGLHGLLALLGRKRIGMILTFLATTFLWVFFRARGIRQAGAYLAGIFSFRSGAPGYGLNPVELGLSFVLIAIMLFREHRWKSHFIRSDTRFALFAGSMTLVCYYLGVFNENQFIYFQF